MNSFNPNTHPFLNGSVEMDHSLGILTVDKGGSSINELIAYKDVLIEKGLSFFLHPLNLTKSEWLSLHHTYTDEQRLNGFGPLAKKASSLFISILEHINRRSQVEDREAVVRFGGFVVRLYPNAFKGTCVIKMGKDVLGEFHTLEEWKEKNQRVLVECQAFSHKAYQCGFDLSSRLTMNGVRHILERNSRGATCKVETVEDIQKEHDNRVRFYRQLRKTEGDITEKVRERFPSFEGFHTEKRQLVFGEWTIFSISGEYPDYVQFECMNHQFTGLSSCGEVMEVFHDTWQQYETLAERLLPFQGYGGFDFDPVHRMCKLPSGHRLNWGTNVEGVKGKGSPTVFSFRYHVDGQLQEGYESHIVGGVDEIVEAMPKHLDRLKIHQERLNRLQKWIHDHYPETGFLQTKHFSYDSLVFFFQHDEMVSEVIIGVDTTQDEQLIQKWEEAYTRKRLRRLIAEDEGSNASYMNKFLFDYAGDLYAQVESSIPHKRFIALLRDHYRANPLFSYHKPNRTMRRIGDAYVWLHRNVLYVDERYEKICQYQKDNKNA